MFRKPLKYGLLLLVVGFVVVQAYMLLAVQGRFAKHLPESAAGGEAVSAGVAGHRIAGRMYVQGEADLRAPLVIVLHGDAPFVLPRYQYLFASQVADTVPGTRVVGLLRPGYGDPYGALSDGPRGFSSGENYTPEVIDDLAAAITELKTRWGNPSVIVVGHSGGASITADIMALHAGLVQAGVLVGCPCDLAPFRKHMAAMQKSFLWLLPVKSVSPLDAIGLVPRDTRIIAISGENDPIALPEYSRAYIARAKAQGNDAKLEILPAQGHEILNEPAVVRQVAQLVLSMTPPAALP